MARYPYVSHLVCNAGVVSLCGFDWPKAILQIFTQPIVALTSPVFKLQTRGEMSVDGYGWIWQCNVFGHYVLVSLLFVFISFIWAYEQHNSFANFNPT